VTDTPDRLNYEKVARICEYLVELCQSLDGTELTVGEQAATHESIESGVVDTTSLEIELIQRAFGDAVEPFLAAIGMESLSSRRDLDQLAARLQNFFEL